MKDLIALAKEMNKVLGCNPPIEITKTTEKKLEKAIQEAAELIIIENQYDDEGELEATPDEFSEKSKNKLIELGFWPEGAEEDGDDDDDDEDDDVDPDEDDVDPDEDPEEEPEEEPAPKKLSSKKAAKVVTKEKPVAKAPAAPKEKVVKPKKEKAPKVEAYTRVDAVCDALKENPKSIDEWVSVTNDFMEANGGKANDSENKFIIRYLLKMEKHFDLGHKMPKD